MGAVVAVHLSFTSAARWAAFPFLEHEMSAASYADALARVLVYEGAYVNHPADPGGATNKGITQAVYDGFRTRKGLSKQSVRLITDTEVREIYRLQYWDKIRGDDLPAGVDFVVFDGGVNSGTRQSTIWLQRALGVAADGLLGEATLKAAREHPDHDALIADILARRLGMLKALKTWKTFGKGWSNRIASVKANGQAMAMGSVGPQPVYMAGMEAKATPEDIKPLPGKGIADAVTGSGAGALVTGGALDQVKAQIEPLAGSLPVVSNIVLALTVVGAVAAVAGICWRQYANARQAKIAAALSGEAIGNLSELPVPA
ncbi:lysozyme family protein [Ancylobacter sp. 3268]|uniref:glycoside hydrolase family 108 protein n=1 Tax=Ancylobacter sp. 3268 TaxID=2817752 RepID=UPI002857539C|nr:glycosyl hydrolase 108 family protein [Ancylobacter sp. 3268]MDR6952285.1 lysozyme family protein [Ancylobacter sp. 3268]